MTVRPDPPPLEFRPPPCPICDVETVVDGDGDYACPDCEAWWDPRRGLCGWDEPSRAQCPETRTRLHKTYRCVRGEEHDTKLCTEHMFLEVVEELDWRMRLRQRRGI